MKQTIDQLQFEQIKKEVQKRAIGQYSKMRIEEMTIQTNLQTVRTRQEETKEARLILDSHQHVPFKASYKNKVPGNIIEQSNKGTTVFIEPVAVEKASMNHQLLKAEEIAEEYQILAFLTGALAEQEQAIDLIIETVTRLDIIFARGKYSREIQGVTPEVNQAEYIKIKQGRHPLLPEDAVPLDFELGNNYRGLVITGANAGGKTVVLKTVGLLTLMAMFGLQVPAAKGTELAVFDEVFVDIGDQQNIENALSTFSGHMQNIAEILRKVKRNTLVLLDEIGSGTEPNEGAALAVAIMETMYEKGALIVATTHYGEIKKFANDHEDFIPAAMAFDREALQPKYLLQVGETGESQALWIAKKMNMSEKLIQQANHYIHDKDYQRKKKEFKVVKAKEPTIKQKKQLFSKGDRVLSTMHQKEALVYEDMGEEMITIYLNKEMIMVPRKRLNLKMSAEQLYPDGYELDQLFTDFQTRKREKDLLRGSKKAHKQLLKEARERKVKKQGEND